MNDWFSARTIVEDDKVQTAADEYSVQFHRFTDVWEGLKWLLARKAEELKCYKKSANGQEFLLYKTAETGDSVPSITVIFTINQNEIYIHGLKAERRESNASHTIVQINQQN